jgi:hypothetical protein
MARRLSAITQWLLLLFCLFFSHAFFSDFSLFPSLSFLLSFNGLLSIMTAFDDLIGKGNR